MKRVRETKRNRKRKIKVESQINKIQKRRDA